MKQILALFAIIAVANAAYLGKNSHGVDIFTINMDDPAELRFNETSVFYKENVQEAVQHYMDLVPEFLLDIVSVIGSYIRWI